MDLTPTTTTATPKSPEPESETPTRIQPAKPISFSNGIIKRHHHLHHHHHHNHAVVPVVYKECLKNHAATLGGHALDGCGEFMPSPTSNPSDPTSLKCAACGCHRNFHRREPDDSSAPVAALPAAHPSSAAAIEYQPHHRHHPPPPVGHPPPPPPGQSRSPNSASPPPISSSYMLLALSGTNNNAGNSLAFSDLNFGGNHLSTHQAPGSRKRFRTKFSQFQKDKMHEFAERVGWKMQKRDEEEIRDFCREIGVDKGVLKVWMHNNKNTLNRRDPFSGIVSGVRRSDNGEGIHTAVAATGDSNNNNGDRSGEGGGVRSIGHDLHHHHGGGFESDSGGANGANANGSSSSS